MNIEQFYRENYRIVFGYLFSLCHDPQLAEDLTSETFLRAILKIGSYDGRVKASTWLCTIGKNLFLNEQKKQRRHISLEHIILADEYNMEEQYILSQQARAVQKLASALEEPKNQVFFMRQQGMSFREIGNALGKTENWARVTYFRAKEKILEGLEESE